MTKASTGNRFGEIATASYGVNPPKNLIHIDINKAVFNANYPASITIEGDAKAVLTGSVTFIQRFGSGANLKPHFHLLSFEGVYTPPAGLHGGTGGTVDHGRAGG